MTPIRFAACGIQCQYYFGDLYAVKTTDTFAWIVGHLGKKRCSSPFESTFEILWCGISDLCIYAVLRTCSPKPPRYVGVAGLALLFYMCSCGLGGWVGWAFNDFKQPVALSSVLQVVRFI